MWQKESKHKNALYVNLCGFGRNLDDTYKDVRSEINVNKKIKSLHAKCDATSSKKQKSAKIYFEDGDWESAILKCNESLCFAENGSSCLGFSYAFRSACFFNMRMYEQCLVDIQLAKENNYPKQLFSELEKRKMSCLKYIANGFQVNVHEPQLNYTADERFSSLSNAIKIELAGKNYRTVVAKQNIDVGQIVAVDKAFTKTSFVIYGWQCNICLKRNTNLVPCKKCTNTMICCECNDKGNGNCLHKYECGMKTSLYSNYNNYLMQELRTFFIAMNMFSNADEMMHFVEHSINSDPLEIPSALDDNRSKYRAFLKQAKNSSDTRDKQFLPIVFCVYKILLEIPQVSIVFASKKHRRFLMHLIGQHVQVNLRQTYVATKPIVKPNGEKEYRRLYSQVGVLLGYFNHSCVPNVHLVDHDGDTIYYALRPIHAGEDLLISYFKFQWNDSSIEKLIELNCVCECCKHKHPSTDDVIEFRKDPDFQYIIRCNLTTDIDFIEREKFDILMEKCVKLLTKYGRILWCTELGVVLTIYGLLLEAYVHGAVGEAQSHDELNNNG
ncbi:uncharacterized protein LOC116342019 [Contarinia nasturtii]|uniref:uncharacterized protein LOC116342019 n=1 Tax=Contarinia nasturtii TaxID=265458 RepID=UPI0012D37F19|nr:uncharacterized protein LOC116342019 [Contarinia nasturtii]